MDKQSSNLIPNFYNRKFLKDALEVGLGTGDIEILRIELVKPASGGENYCSNIYRACVEYKTGNHASEISLIIKNLPIEKQGVLKSLNVFGKESFFYLDIKPKLETLMWYTNALWELGARHILSTTQPEPTIIMEDLSMHGYTMRSRQLGLERADTLLVLEKIAQYHALTMVLAHKNPTSVVDRFRHGLLNIASIQSPAFKALFGAQLLKLASIAMKWPGYEEISKKLYKYHGNFEDMVMKSVYPLEGAINVLNHGDIWVNNLLFKYQPADVRFIDFQLCFYGSPGFDLNYFFNTSVQLEVLLDDRDALIECYFNALTGTLQKLPFGLPPPTLELIRREIREREGYGFFVAFGFLPLMAMKQTDSQDNSLENFHDSEFATKKIDKMFQNHGRTQEMLKYALRRSDELGIFD